MGIISKKRCSYSCRVVKVERRILLDPASLLHIGHVGVVADVSDGNSSIKSVWVVANIVLRSGNRIVWALCCCFPCRPLSAPSHSLPPPTPSRPPTTFWREWGGRRVREPKTYEKIVNIILLETATLYDAAFLKDAWTRKHWLKYRKSVIHIVSVVIRWFAFSPQIIKERYPSFVVF